MKEVLKKYTMILTCESPVFIGDGKTINKKEYILDKNKVYVLNLPMMYAGLKKLHLDVAFESYLLNNQRDRLKDWMLKNKVKSSVWMDWVEYSLDYGDVIWQDKKPPEIHQFVKDPYGHPYVPGSSVKGMLRTILLAWEIGRTPSSYGKIRQNVIQNASSGNRKSCLQREVTQLEGQAFRRLDRQNTRWQDAVNDVLSGVIVGDSRPLDTADLSLCQKIDVNKAGNEKKLPLLRETLKPGTTIHVPITIDQELCSYSPEVILKAVNYFGNVYDQSFRKKYKICQALKQNEVWLGGGSGFLTKTELYPLIGGEKAVKAASDVFYATLGPKIYNMHKHKGDIANGVSPHTIKFTQYKGKFYEMGKCNLKIIRE